ncbi:MAG: hypothetical protein WCJ94_03905 [bacterium]
MFCPNCLYEYKEGVLKCEDCGADLVAELPAEEDGDLPDIEVSELAEVQNDVEAGALTAMLTASGIYSFVRSNILPHTGINLSFFNKKSYGTIIINKEDLKRGKEILEDFKKSLKKK